MEPKTKTCGPYPGGFILTHTHIYLQSRLVDWSPQPWRCQAAEPLKFAKLVIVDKFIDWLKFPTSCITSGEEGESLDKENTIIYIYIYIGVGSSPPQGNCEIIADPMQTMKLVWYTRVVFTPFVVVGTTCNTIPVEGRARAMQQAMSLQAKGLGGSRNILQDSLRPT